MAFVVLILAVLSRVLPALLHTTGANVTMVGAGLLFFGSRLRADRRYLVLLAIALLAASDYWLTVYAYGYPFSIASYLPTWLWYAAVPLAASAGLHRRHGVRRIGAAALLSSTSFFLVSNGAVWFRGGMYPHSAAGLGACYVAGLPFYRNDVASTLVFSAVFFSLPFAAKVLRDAGRSLGEHSTTSL
jgi:hypothetical protein